MIFDVEEEDQETGEIEIQGERMWVIVSEKIGDVYIGILDNKPAGSEEWGEFYLCFGAEIPFLPEHVIDIADPPSDYVEWQLKQPLEHRWPRDP